MQRKLTKPIGLLSLLALLSACSKTPPPAVIANDKLCESWKHQTVSRKDKLTDETASQIEGGNKSRPAWGCEYGSNRAKGGTNG